MSSSSTTKPEATISLEEIFKALRSEDEPTSPPVEFKWDGRTVTCVFRLLSEDEHDQALLDAAQFVSEEKHRRLMEAREKNRMIDADWVTETSPALQAVQASYADMLVLMGATLNPVTKIPVGTLDDWKSLPPATRQYLRGKYDTFENSYLPSVILDERAAEAIEYGKKKDIVSLWTQFDSRVLAFCVISLAAQLEFYQTGESQPSSSGEASSESTH